MKSFLYSIIFLAYCLLTPGISSGLFSQNSYQLLFGGPKSASTTGILSFPSGSSIIFIGQGTSVETSSSSLYKITSKGEIFGYGMNKTDTLLYVQEIILDSLNVFIMHGGGYYVDGNEILDRFFWIASMDTSFQENWFKTYHFAPDNLYPSALHSRVLKISDGEFLHAGLSSYGNSFRKHIFRFNSAGDSLQLKIFPVYSGIEEVYSLTYNPDSSKLDIHLSRYLGNNICEANGDRLNLDTFDSLSSFYYPQSNSTPFYFFSPPYTTKTFPETCMITSGSYTYGNENNDPIDVLGVFIFDENYNVLVEQRLTDNIWEDIRVIPTDMNCIDYVFPDQIYVSGVYDFPSGFGVSELDCWVYVAKLDQNLNIIWEKYLGGDAWYRSSCMKATYDGGVMLTGRRFDENINVGTETDVYVWKLDSDGMVNIREGNSLQIKQAIVFPNPSKDKIYLRTVLLDTKFILYDLHGEEVLNKPIKEKTSLIDISSLLKGEYVWNLVGEKGILENGKLIKH